MRTPLTDESIAEALAGLPGWRREGDELVAEWTVPRAEVPGFYLAIAGVEDELDHHAQVGVLYGTVTLRVNTHDAGHRITARDVDLARRVSELAARY